MSKISVRKDLKANYQLYTETGFLIDNNADYECLTIYTQNNPTGITVIKINDEWHEVNNIDFE